MTSAQVTRSQKEVQSQVQISIIFMHQSHSQFLTDFFQTFKMCQSKGDASPPFPGFRRPCMRFTHLSHKSLFSDAGLLPGYLEPLTMAALSAEIISSRQSEPRSNSPLLWPAWSAFRGAGPFPMV